MVSLRAFAVLDYRCDESVIWYEMKAAGLLPLAIIPFVRLVAYRAYESSSGNVMQFRLLGFDTSCEGHRFPDR